MTSTDRNYLVPAQEKLEWVTPKISLMEAGDTDGSNKPFREKSESYGNNIFNGPS
jgi:hypothetical protein